MRVSKEKAAENRERILNAAAALMREHGISGVGVDALSEAAGLTHGGLYSRFGSKDRLMAEALQQALDGNASVSAAARDFKSYVNGYLSPRHRDTPGEGCALAALGAEIARSSPAARKSFTDGLRRLVEAVAQLMQRNSKAAKTDDALATLSTLVGALTLARAVDDPQLSDRILAAARRSLLSPR